MTPSHHLPYDALASFIPYSVPDMPPLSQDFLIGAASNMFDGAVSAVSKANERLALAYQSGQAGDQTQLKYAGFAVVGLAAVMLFSRMGK